MRTLLKSLLLGVCITFVFAQCGGGKSAVNQKKPEAVAVAFLKHFSALEFDKAKALATEESQSFMEMMESMMAMVGEAELEELAAEAEEEAKMIKEAECRQEGDMAYCKICCDEYGNMSEDESIKLKKENGKWYVHMTKEDLGLDGEEGF